MKMKWWYVLVVMIGALLGWWLFGRKEMKKTTSVASVSGGDVQKEIVGIPTIVVKNKKGEDVGVTQVIGVVQTWSPETGVVEFMSDKKLWKLSVDPTEAIVLTPSLKTKDRIIMITNKSNVHWSSAFCKGDEVAVRLSGEKMVAISNGGYRACGFKDD